MTKDIYVFIEQREGQIQDVSYELLEKANQLVKERKILNYKVVAVLLGYGVSELAKECIYHKADEVIVYDAHELKEYSTHYYTDILTRIIKENNPDSLLIGATTIGRDLAPRVAARVNTGLTADATQIEFDQQNQESSVLWITRPALGGNLYGTIVCEEKRPQMASVRPGVFEKAERNESLNGSIIVNEYIPTAKDRVKIISKVKKEERIVDLSKARIVIGVGRGMANELELVYKVAKEIGAEVGVTRPVIEQGLASKELQIGQTGKIIKPIIYIACGISGAVQHTSGVDKSELIIAINTDPNALIFTVSDLGFVGDAKLVLPKIKDELIKLLENKS